MRPRKSFRSAPISVSANCFDNDPVFLGISDRLLTVDKIGEPFFYTLVNHQSSIETLDP
jgi:hypothetical protein